MRTPLDYSKSTQLHDASERRHPARAIVVGGVISADEPFYLERDADEQLFHIAAAGEYGHVFAPRHSGKSSLTARVAEKLRSRDRAVAVVDLSQIGPREGAADAGRWFYGFAFRLVRQLRLKVDLQDWWQDKSNLTNRQRLTELYWDIILENTSGPVTIFVDTPQSFDSLPFAGDLLASINSAHNARAAEPEFSRLNFVVLATGEPRRSAVEGALSLFAGSERIELLPFTEQQMEPLSAALNLPADDAIVAIERIRFWTGGQPFLSMKLARAVARQSQSSQDVPALVDKCVKQLFSSPAACRAEPHLSSLQNMLLHEARDSQKLLAIFGRIRKGARVRFEPDSALQRKLLGEGLVRRADDVLVVANRIYELGFTSRWINEHLRIDFRHATFVSLAVILAVLLPLWYSQILPRGWISRITNPETLTEATDAHERMRAWPGHRTTANRLLADHLEERSDGSVRLDSVLEYTRLLRELPGTTSRADALVARFWDRKAADFERAGERDEALISRLNALSQPTPERRRKVAALVSEDYPSLLTTLRTPAPIEHAALSRDAGRLTMVSGTTISAWALTSDPPLPFPPWEATALTLQPIVSRMSVDHDRAAGSVQLTVKLSHDRYEDLIIRLTAPSGRSVQLQPSLASQTETGEFSFDGARDGWLAELRGEPASGTWTISIADTVPAITGSLSSWALDFAGPGASDFVQSEQQPIPDPAPSADARVVLSPSGRYAVAIPHSSVGVPQVWDVAGRQAVASLPLLPEDRILGFVLDERVLVVARQTEIAAWALATGESSWAPDISGSIRQSALSLNGQFLVVATGGEAAGSTIYDLIEGRKIGVVASHIDHEAIAIANGGNLIAVADADRTVRLWQPDLSTPVAEYAVDAEVRSLNFDAQAQYLAIATDADQLVVWPVGKDTGAALRVPHADDWAVAFDPDGGGALFGSPVQGYQLHESDLAAADVPLLRPTVTGGRHELQLRLDHNAVLAYGKESGVAQVWRLPQARDATAGNPRNPVRAAVSQDLEWLAAERAPGELSIFSLDAGPEDLESHYDRVTYFGHAAPIEQLCFSSNGALAASAANDGSVRVWDTTTGRPRSFIIRSPAQSTQALAFSFSGRQLVVASAIGIQSWDTTNGALLAEVRTESAVTSLNFTLDDAYLLAGQADGAVVRFSVKDEYRQDRYPVATTPILSLATQGLEIVVADSAGNIYRLPSWSDKLPQTLVSDGEPCRELAISPDRAFVACRGTRWLRRISMSEPWNTLVRVLPPTAVYPGLTVVAEDASELAIVAGNGIPVPVALMMDASDVAPLAGAPEELIRSWRNRLGFAATWSPDPPPVAEAATGL